MAHQQRLKLTLRNVGAGRTWVDQPLEITADPEDHAAIREHIEQMARDLDGRTGNPWWADQYKLRVQGLDQEWRDFWLTGGGR